MKFWVSKLCPAIRQSLLPNRERCLQKGRSNGFAGVGVSSESSKYRTSSVTSVRANLHSRYYLELRGQISAVVFYGRYKPYEY